MVTNLSDVKKCSNLHIAYFIASQGPLSKINPKNRHKCNIHTITIIKLTSHYSTIKLKLKCEGT